MARPILFARAVVGSIPFYKVVLLQALHFPT